MALDGAHIRTLQQELDRLQNALVHLVQSNVELKAAIEEEGDEDRTYKQAIEDNIVTIAKYRAASEHLEAELRELRAGRHQLGAEQTVPTEDTSAAPAGAQQQQQQQVQQGSAPGGDTAMAEAAEQQPQAHADQQAGGGGMWM